MTMPNKEKIVLIGAGNVATHLAAALQENGYPIAGIYSRSSQAAETLAAKIGCIPFTDFLHLPEADIYLYCVKDDVLPVLAATIAPLHSAALHLHTAGSISIDIFKGHCLCYGVLYPLQTFSKARPVNFKEIPCFAEACNEETLKAVVRLGESLSEQVHTLNSERRRYLHLSAVFANNFANHCFALAQEIISQKVLLPTDVLSPLIRETVNKLNTMTAKAAQTGPAARNDQSVMNAQAELLNSIPAIKAFYENASQSIVSATQSTDQISKLSKT